ncbi:MAG TPA: diguanylate cyclase [Candidatus Hypogeohydataceae bacterium YC41]
MDESAVYTGVRFYLLAQEKENIPEEVLGNLSSVSLVIGDLITDQELCSAEVIMLYVMDEKWGKETVKAIRTQPNLFLKPLLIISERRVEELKEVADEEIVLPVSKFALSSSLEKILHISKKVTGLVGVSELVSESRIKEILLLRFLYTRNGYLLKPVRNLASSLGYSYPLVQLLLDVLPGNEVGLIEGLEETLMLKGELLDKVNLCPFCGHFQINFREVCPDCHSMKIEEEATIHHYRCAYVGKEKEFREGSELRCPKCRKELRHIGVDYERPIENFWCSACGSNFSEGIVECLCLNCGKIFSPENVPIKQIREYSLTPEGQQAAEKGILPGLGLMDILRKEIGFYKLEVFKELLGLEVLRCRRYKYSSTLVRVHITNFKDINAEWGVAHAQEVSREFSTFLERTFRETDVLTDISADEFLVIFTHTDVEKAKIALDRLKAMSSSLFKRKLDLEYYFLDLGAETGDAEAILERIKC